MRQTHDLSMVAQAFTVTAFQTAIDRGEISPETDIKLLLDLLYGYSVFRLITRQIDDDQIVDRICAAIAKLARSGLPSPTRTENQRRSGVLSRTILLP